MTLGLRLGPAGDREASGRSRAAKHARPRPHKYRAGEHPLEVAAARAGVHSSVAALLTEGSPQVISFTVPGRPVPKERARSGGGHFYTPERTETAEAAVLAAFLGVTRRMLDDRGPWGIVATAYLPDLGGGDGDNIVKLVKDALSGKGRRPGAAWRDDKQVISGLYGTVLDRDNPRTEITIYRIGSHSVTIGDSECRRADAQSSATGSEIVEARTQSPVQEEAPGHDNGPPASGPSVKLQSDSAGPASPSGSSTS